MNTCHGQQLCDNHDICLYISPVHLIIHDTVQHCLCDKKSFGIKLVGYSTLNIADPEILTDE